MWGSESLYYSVLYKYINSPSEWTVKTEYIKT